MKIVLSKHFGKKYKKLRESEKRKFKQKRDIFLRDPYYPLLNNHALTGECKGYRSINITGDLRAVFRLIDDQTTFFITIDTHSNLYS